jgi:CHAD domain-containing protein
MAPARKVRGLTCDDSFSGAAGKIIWTRFDEMMSFTDVALEGKDIEGVHDMRVGSRRLRAALEIFRDAFPKRQLKPMLRDVKRLADALGEVRDLDVMLDRLQADMAGRSPSQRLVLKEMMQEMRAQREGARDALKETIDDLERSDFPRRFLVFVAKATT